MFEAVVIALSVGWCLGFLTGIFGLLGIAVVIAAGGGEVDGE